MRVFEGEKMNCRMPAAATVMLAQAPEHPLLEHGRPSSSSLVTCPACLVTPSPPPSFAARAGRVGAMSSASVDDAEATKVRAVDDAPRTHRAARLAAGTETRIVFARG
jgi:hypothetical protein